MIKRYRLCTCGHRKYKHTAYPIEAPFCKGKPWCWVGTIVDIGCPCALYEPMDNLEYLEWCSDKQAGNNAKRIIKGNKG